MCHRVNPHLASNDSQHFRLNWIPHFLGLRFHFSCFDPPRPHILVPKTLQVLRSVQEFG